MDNLSPNQRITVAMALLEAVRYLRFNSKSTPSDAVEELQTVWNLDDTDLRTVRSAVAQFDGQTPPQLIAAAKSLLHMPWER